MKVIDRRERTKHLPIPEILTEIIPLFRKQNVGGIRRIVLLDQDYRKGEHAAGRYCQVRGTKQADIEMFFDHIAALPSEVRASRMYLTYRVTHTLMHEIYHHIVRGQARLRKRKLHQEERDAENWSTGAIRHVFESLYPREQYESEWLRINAILDRDSTDAQQVSGADADKLRSTE